MTIFTRLIESLTIDDRNKIIKMAISSIKEALKIPAYKKYSKIINIGLQDNYKESNEDFISYKSDEVIIAEFLDTNDPVLVYEIPRKADRIFNHPDYKIEGFEYCFALIKK